ncbi:MAG TPA: LAGLIDADG family homing endonuclease [Candidatus Paceibacterota bacterium]
MPVYRTLNHAFFSAWSSDMAYVLGFFAADGSMLKNRRGAHFIEFNITDGELLFLIQKTLGSDHLISRRKRKPQYSYVYRLQVGSKQLFADLEKLGFTQAKSNSLRMPVIPKKFLPDFVRGYFDGDGCIYFKRLKFADRKKPRWVLQTIFTCGSKRFLRDLQLILQQYGVAGGSIRRKTRGFDLLLSHRDSVALFKIMYHTIPATGLFLPRKYNTFCKAIKILYPDAVVV